MCVRWGKYLLVSKTMTVFCSFNQKQGKMEKFRYTVNNVNGFIICDSKPTEKNEWKHVFTRNRQKTNKKINRIDCWKENIKCIVQLMENALGYILLVWNIKLRFTKSMFHINWGEKSEMTRRLRKWGKNWSNRLIPFDIEQVL